jgi:hypothetical protein
MFSGFDRWWQVLVFISGTSLLQPANKNKLLKAICAKFFS